MNLVYFAAGLAAHALGVALGIGVVAAAIILPIRKRVNK